MRWVEGTSQGSPLYCQTCQQQRKATTRCDGCNAVDVWPELEPVKTVYLAMQTQWQRDGMGQITGLNYNTLKVVMEFNGIKPSKEFFGFITAIEREVLKIANSKAEKSLS